MQNSTATCPDSATQLSTEKWLRFPPDKTCSCTSCTSQELCRKATVSPGLLSRSPDKREACFQQHACIALLVCEARHLSMLCSLHTKYTLPKQLSILAHGEPQCCKMSTHSTLIPKAKTFGLGMTEKLAKRFLKWFPGLYTVAES